MGTVHTQRYQELLKRLREARERSGLTQSQVAQKLGRPQSYVSKCESGERRLDAIELETFAKVYGTSVPQILGEKAGRR